ncbi:MAG: winged helix-turn-helix transcriptional regulator [Cyclobacteriaceae bacterium]|nr:winged helix-turn-helix transcriptional regulator [Cyclobacteriaceae bacterium]
MRLKNFSLTFGTSIFKSLSEEARVRILNLLYENGEMCSSDLELILDFTQTKTSRHLSYLKNAGIINARKADQWVFYSIKEEVQDVMELVLNYMKKDHVLSQDIQTFKTMYSNRELAAYKIGTKKWQSRSNS